MTTLVVMAKACVPGRVKTRLHPPYTLDQAARIAEACLRDTLAFADGLSLTRRVLCFAGDRPPVDPSGWDVVAQGPGSLDERIATVLDACSGPTLLIGMDTPQVRPADVAPALAWPQETDAWLGMADDGGYWALGLREPRGELVRGVPMSRTDTGRRQRDRLLEAGLTVGALPELTDVDTAEDLASVAARLDTGHLARLMAHRA